MGLLLPEDFLNEAAGRKATEAVKPLLDGLDEKIKSLTAPKPVQTAPFSPLPEMVDVPKIQLPSVEQITGIPKVQPAQATASGLPPVEHFTGGMSSGSGSAQPMPSASGGGTAPVYQGSGAPAGDGEIEQYIRQAAQKRGIDPDIAVAVANSEGSVTEPARRGTFSTGSSWWPFQLHYGGTGYESLGDTAGMGNDFTAKTGIAPGDPNGWRQSVDYALDQAKAGGWGPWYGAKAIGVTGMQGIGDAPSGSQAMLASESGGGSAAPEGGGGGPQNDSQGQDYAGPDAASDQSSPVANSGYQPGSAAISAPGGTGSNGTPTRDNAWSSGDLSQPVASGSTWQDTADQPFTPDPSAVASSGAEADPGGGLTPPPPVEQPKPIHQQVAEGFSQFGQWLGGIMGGNSSDSGTNTPPDFNQPTNFERQAQSGAQHRQEPSYGPHEAWDTLNNAVEPFTATGIARETLGREQQTKEHQGEEQQLQSLLTQLDEAERSGDTATADSLRAQIQPLMDTLNQVYKEDPRVASERNPQTGPVTTAINVGQGVVASAIAPSIGSGLARNIAGAAIDPAGQAFGAGLGAVGEGIAHGTGELARNIPRPRGGTVPEMASGVVSGAGDGVRAPAQSVASQTDGLMHPSGYPHGSPGERAHTAFTEALQASYDGNIDAPTMQRIMGNENAPDLNTIRQKAQDGWRESQWYKKAAGVIEDALGPEAAQASARELGDLIGITTQSSPAAENIPAGMFLYGAARKLALEGQPITRDTLVAEYRRFVAEAMPATRNPKFPGQKEAMWISTGEGGTEKALGNNMLKNASNLYNDGEHVIRAGSKSTAFGGNFISELLGLRDPNTVIDRHIYDIFGAPKKGFSPADNQRIQAIYSVLADEAGVPPREYQAATWVGHKFPGLDTHADLTSKNGFNEITAYARQWSDAWREAHPNEIGPGKVSSPDYRGITTPGSGLGVPPRSGFAKPLGYDQILREGGSLLERDPTIVVSADVLGLNERGRLAALIQPHSVDAVGDLTRVRIHNANDNAAAYAAAVAGKQAGLPYVEVYFPSQGGSRYVHASEYDRVIAELEPQYGPSRTTIPQRGRSEPGDYYSERPPTGYEGQAGRGAEASQEVTRNATAGTPGGLLPGSPAGGDTEITNALTKVGKQAVQGGVAGGVGVYQHDPNASPEDYARGIIGGAAQRVALGAVRDRAGIQTAARVARIGRETKAAPEPTPDDITHVKGFGIFRGVNDMGKDVLERVAAKGRQFPEGVSRADLGDVANAILPSPEEVAKKWNNADTRTAAAEVETLRRGAAASIDQLMDDARHLTDTNDFNTLLGAVDHLTDATTANEFLTGTRRAAESAGRTLNAFKNDINVQMGRDLFQQLDRSASEVDKGAEVLDGLRNGTGGGGRGAADRLERAAGAVETIGTKADDATKVLKRQPEKYIDPLVEQVKVREDIKQTLDRAIQNVINQEKRAAVREEIQGMADDARETINKIIANTSDTGLRDDLAEQLGKMREHSNVGEQAANRMQQVFDQRMNTWAKNYMDRVESRNVAREAGRQADAEKFMANVDKSITDLEAKNGKSAKLDELKGMRKEARDLIKVIAEDPTNETLKRRFELLTQDIGTHPHGGPAMAVDFYNAMDARMGKVAESAQKVVDKQTVTDLAAKLREMAGIVRSGNTDPAMLQGIDDLYAQMGAIGKVGRDRSTQLKDSLTRQGLVRYAGKLDEDKIAQFTTLLKSIDPERPETLARIMSLMSKGTFTDSIIEYSVANMLSSPATQVVNIGSNALQGAAYYGIKHPLMVLYSSLGRDGAVNASELKASGAGLINGMSTGLKAFGETMKYGYSNASLEKAAQLGDFGGVHRELLTEKFGPVGAALHAISTRPLQAADELFQNMFYSANLNILADREAHKLGTTPTEVLNNLMDHLDLVKEAGRMSDYSLLKGQDRVTQTMSTLTALNDGKKNVPAELIKHWLFPFVRTPWNVLKQGIEFSPVGTTVNLGKLVKNEIRGEDPVRAADLASNVMAGAGLAGIGFTGWANGTISGDGPTDIEKRRMMQSEGWQPRSIKVGNQWVSYDSTPFAIPLGSMVTGMERYQEAVDKGEAKGKPAEFWQFVQGAGVGTAASFLNQSFVKNAADIYENVRQGDVKPDSLISNFASRYIPAGSMVAYLARMGDSLQRETRMVDNPAIAAIQERTPLRGQLPAHQDVLGRGMENDQRLPHSLLPAPRRSTDRQDRVISAFQDAGVDIGAPPTQLTVDKVPIDLSPSERQTYQRFLGEELTRLATGTTNGPNYVNLPESVRKTTLEGVMTDAKKLAQERTLGAIGGGDVSQRVKDAAKVKAGVR